MGPQIARRQVSVGGGRVALASVDAALGGVDAVERAELAPDRCVGVPVAGQGVPDGHLPPVGPVDGHGRRHRGRGHAGVSRPVPKGGAKPGGGTDVVLPDGLGILGRDPLGVLHEDLLWDMSARPNFTEPGNGADLTDLKEGKVGTVPCAEENLL